MAIENLDSLLIKLNNIGDLDLTEPLTKACILVQNDAKRNCPVDTGQLRSSITYEVEPQQGVIGTNVEYAPYVEYGTGIWSSKGDGRQDRWSYQDAEGNWHSTIGQKPQPFLHPALQANKDGIMELINDYVEKEVKQ